MDKINMDYKLNFSNHLIKLLTKIDFLFMMQFPASTCIIYVAYLLFARITSYQDNSHSFYFRAVMNVFLSMKIFYHEPVSCKKMNSNHN